MKRTYQRSRILSFFELDHEQQFIATNDQGENAQESMYVFWDNEPLSLNNFMRNNNGLFHGTYGLTYFSAYLVRFNRTNEAATVVYAHW